MTSWRIASRSLSHVSLRHPWVHCRHGVTQFRDGIWVNLRVNHLLF
jgi:hypothetical protein